MNCSSSGQNIRERSSSHATLQAFLMLQTEYVQAGVCITWAARSG